MKAKMILLSMLALLLYSCSQEELKTSLTEDKWGEPTAELKISRLLAAEDVTLDLASQIGTSSGKEELRSFSGKSIKSSYSISEEGRTLLHIVNYSPGGYIITSATKNYAPILAYDELGEINPSSMSPALENVIEGYKKVVKGSASLPDSLKRRYAIEWEMLNLKADKERIKSLVPNEYIEEQLKKLQEEGYQIYTYDDVVAPWSPFFFGVNIKEHLRDIPSNEVFMIVRTETTSEFERTPMLTTTWAQENGYNRYNPHYDPQHPSLWPIGCVAVAVGQIMKYHKFPASYDWSVMEDARSTDETARLLGDIALGVHMEFKIGSGTSNIANAQKYLTSIGYQTRIEDFSVFAVSQKLRSGSGPIYLRGEAVEGADGHAYITDGCRSHSWETRAKLIRIIDIAANDANPSYYDILRDDYLYGGGATYFHLNMGWGGYEDGYYRSEDFTYSHNMLYMTISKPRR